MVKKSTLILLLTLWAARFVAAQTGSVIYEGTRLDYSVDLHNGNIYAWTVENATNTVEYNFTTVSDNNKVGVQWNLAGSYLLRVTESHPTGCSSSRQIQVTVEQNNRSFEFNMTASSECFNKGDNSFSLPFEVLDNNKQALSSAYFPMNIDFLVNGNLQTQTVIFNKQELIIAESGLALKPLQDNEIIVQVTNVTDAKNVSIPGLANATHNRTIFALPTIEFTEELRRKYQIDEEAFAHIVAYNNPDAMGHPGANRISPGAK